MLAIDLKIGETVKIGESTVTIDEKSGRFVRLLINASKEIPVKKVQKNTISDFARQGMHKES